MPELLKALIFGIIEGITEWLPVSSTGHMILADEFIKLSSSAEFKEMFLVVIQLGAILAVLVLYFHRLNPFSKKKTAKEKSGTFMIWFKVLVACLPAAIIGFLFDDTIDELFYNPFTVAFMLILYGIFFILVERRNKARAPRACTPEDLTFADAFFIGAFQVLSLIPGTSRSGATILGGILIGVSRSAAAEFTFFLGIPVMFGASLLKLVKFGVTMSAGEAGVLAVGMLSAFLVSIVAIRFLMGYIKKHDFKIFGWYRIALGAVVLLFFIF